MKHIFKISTLFLLVFSIFFQSCSVDNNPESETNFQAKSGSLKDVILQDSNFKSFLLDSYNFHENIRDYGAFASIMGDYSKELTLSQKAQVASALGLSSYGQYLDYLNVQNSRIAYLEREYNFSQLPTRDKNEIIGIGLEGIVPIESNAVDCARRYRNCKIIANSAAVVAHLGCGFADLTVVAGLICHGAVLTGLYAALDNCRMDYEDCRDAK